MNKTRFPTAIRFPKSIAVDLDGVLLEIDWQKWWKRGQDYFGRPIPGAFEALRKLKEMGYKIIIYTCRTSPNVTPGFTAKQLADRVEEKLRDMGFEFDEIWYGEGKPAVDIYLDDMAMHFDGDWDKTLKKIEEKGSFKED